MFGKSKKTTQKARTADGSTGSPWDEDTLGWLASCKIIEVSITQVDRTLSFGRERPDDKGSPPESSVTGYLLHAPQHVHFTLSFVDFRQETLGWGELSQYDYKWFDRQRISLPRLDLRATDEDGHVQQAVVESLRNSAHGNDETIFGFYPKFADGWLEGKRSGESVYYRLAVDRFFIASRLRSPRCPEWASPLDENWNLNDYPDPTRLREATR